MYTRALVDDIRGDTETLVRTYALGVQALASEEPGDRASEVIFDQVIKGFPYPVIATDAFGEPLFFRNLSYLGIDNELPPWSEEELHLLREAARGMDRRSRPIEISGANGRVIQLIHYQESGFITLLSYLPYIQAFGFVLVAFFALWAIRYNLRLQQGQIWVAMARESAHQMGTPLSSLYGWIELLRAQGVGAEPGASDRHLAGSGGDATDAGPRGAPTESVAAAMEQDLNRLTKVANRFELIGRRPKLEPLDLRDVLAELRRYFEARLPRLGHRVELSLELDDTPPVLGNRVLLEWAFENLIKNSADALQGRAGSIRIEVNHDPGSREIEVVVRDDGAGIPRHLRKRIFKAGVSTKPAGWGVGLALARRILQDYHGGRLDLVESEVGKGSTFRAVLPVTDLPLEAPRERRAARTEAVETTPPAHDEALRRG